MSYFNNGFKKTMRISVLLFLTFNLTVANSFSQNKVTLKVQNANVSQVLDEIEGEIVFFGDKCEPGGNDYPIVERLFPLIDEHTIHNVKDWKETYKILKQYN